MAADDFGRPVALWRMDWNYLLGRSLEPLPRPCISNRRRGGASRPWAGYHRDHFHNRLAGVFAFGNWDRVSALYPQTETARDFGGAVSASSHPAAEEILCR